MRVLITNLRLAGRTGTELYVRDLALGLLKRGHQPMAYSPRLGPLAQELREAGVQVVDQLRALAQPPDLIQGHQHPETMAALLRFAEVPALYVCHDRLDWHSEPPRFPRILRYAAVSQDCRERLVRASIPEERIRVVFNGVDLDRFQPRGPLPLEPRRALVFSNGASERTFLPAVREACRRAGLELDVMGQGAGRSATQPEALLGRYDLVFAKGRCAREALAVGAAVVLLDLAGAGPMVTVRDLEFLSNFNFGLKALSRPIEPETLFREIARYDPTDAAEVSRRVRQSGGLDRMVDALLGLYHEIHAEGLRALDPAAEKAAAARYLRDLGLLGRAYCGLYRSWLGRRLHRHHIGRWPLVGPALRKMWLRLLLRQPA